MTFRVALAGSTGKIGPTILRVLLQAQFEVVILTRKGSTSTNIIPKHAKQTIVAVNYTDPLIDACIGAGVRRFIPSEFSLDLHNPKIRNLPIYPGKLATQTYLDRAATTNPSFTYTYVYTGVWLDWGIDADFIFKAKEHKATLWDGGNIKFSTTRLETVGKAVVVIINHQELTKNRPVYVHDTAVTMNDLIGIIKSIDGIEWATEEKGTADEEKSAYEQLSRPVHAQSGARVSFLSVVAFGKHYNPDFTERLDNALLGIPELQRSELVDVVRGILSAK